MHVYEIFSVEFSVPPRVEFETTVGVQTDVDDVARLILRDQPELDEVHVARTEFRGKPMCVFIYTRQGRSIHCLPVFDEPLEGFAGRRVAAPAAV